MRRLLRTALRELSWRAIQSFTGIRQSAYNQRKRNQPDEMNATRTLLMELLVKLLSIGPRREEPASKPLFIALRPGCRKALHSHSAKPPKHGGISRRLTTAKSLVIAFAAITLTGCASIQARNPADPLEPFNRGIYQFNDVVDKAIVKPVAQGYSAVIPAPGKLMVSNFFSNLDDITVAINDLLQFKLVRAFSDGGRFLINTTVGIFGLMDIATPIGLEKHDEDFGQTLGYWGIGNGPYIVLPLLGPSTLRDSVGLYTDSRPSGLRRVHPVRTRNQLYFTQAINHRAQLLDQEKVLDEAALDRYEFIRDSYLQRRQSLVYDGNPPREKYDDEENGFEYQKVPTPNAPSSQQDNAPAAAPASTTQQRQPAFDAPQIDVVRPSIHKVWIAQRTGIR